MRIVYLLACRCGAEIDSTLPLEAMGWEVDTEPLRVTCPVCLGDRVTPYDADYFLRGLATGKSLYEDYRWMPELTVPMVRAMVAHLGICQQDGDTVLDFGCARGYVVRALRELGYEAFGADVSPWAIDNADAAARPYLTLLRDCGEERLAKLDGTFDWIIAKDVLEHVPYVGYAVGALMGAARRGVFAVVPLSDFDGAPYAVPDYERDVTHIHRYRLPTWAAMFMRPGWRVEAAYRVPGVKDNYASWATGNGFVTCRRVEG